MNLNADKAKWEGYNIILKEGDEYLYFVGVLRRLFVPPDLGTFSDFLIMMKFNIQGQATLNFDGVNQDQNWESSHLNPFYIFDLIKDSLESQVIETEIFKD